MTTTIYGSPYVSGTDLVANWPAASLTVANSIDAAGYYIGRGINAQTASYTGVLTDAGKTVTMTNAGATTFTVPANASVAYPTGTRINILNLGAGACTPTAGAGVTISGTITALATNESASVIKTATNTWSYLAAPTPTAPGLSLVTPTSVAGTGVTLSGGAVSFSASSTVSVNGCFTSAYANYRVVCTFSSAASVAMNIRMRVSGTDSSASSYYKQYILGQSTTVSGARTGPLTTWETMYADNEAFLTCDFGNPAPAANTSMILQGGNSRSTGPEMWITGGFFMAATAFDGFTLYPSSSNITGTLRVYGLRNS